MKTQPQIRLLNPSIHPFSDAVSSARTCYSKNGIILPGQIDPLKDKEKWQGLLQGIFEAGHHTTLQHTHLHFALENISRNCIWSFLHSHSFYNSEQVSQRYVKVNSSQFFYPSMQPKHHALFEKCYQNQIQNYHFWKEKLQTLVETEYLRRFPSRKGSLVAKKEVEKRCQEIARYVLPLGTTAYLHHTISLLTLLRYHQVCKSADLPSEQKELVVAMVNAVLEKAPEIAFLFQSPIEESEFPENSNSLFQNPLSSKKAQEEFDLAMGDHSSVLCDYNIHFESVLAQSIRNVLGLCKEDLNDEEAILLVLDPQKNHLYANTLNLAEHSKLMRTLAHGSYTFQKKLSHSADSQNQRHRMTPGSRPLLHRHFSQTPDVILPFLIARDEKLAKIFLDQMKINWDFIHQALESGLDFERTSYLLPNALSIRFYETASLLNLQHKMSMRLCYNAQEEIWKASLEEAKAIEAVHPKIAKILQPPCKKRKAADVKPFCPEGNRFCGVAVWKLEKNEWQRSI